MGVGEKIKQKRKEKGYTLKRLSEIVDISVSFLSDIENGKSKPSLDRLTDIARGLDANVSYFLGEEAKEEKLIYEEKYLDIFTDDEIKKLLEEEDFLQILDEFKGFDKWTKQEKEELKMFLQIKNKYKD
ncbi:MAG: helix-turn-helix domain-containing protein [Peptostreptococcales bacterium]|jgi:transcriptional regulator with XRE-family HTH domain